jgi:hypothetical protein
VRYAPRAHRALDSSRHPGAKIRKGRQPQEQERHPAHPASGAEPVAFGESRPSFSPVGSPVACPCRSVIPHHPFRETDHWSPPHGFIALLAMVRRVRYDPGNPPSPRPHRSTGCRVVHAAHLTDGSPLETAGSARHDPSSPWGFLTGSEPASRIAPDDVDRELRSFIVRRPLNWDALENGSEVDEPFGAMWCHPRAGGGL